MNTLRTNTRVFTPFTHWGLLDQFQKELGQYSNDSNTGRNWVPAVDIKEEGERYLIEVDIPGVETKDIEVSVENSVLTVKGERNFEKAAEGNHYQRIERVHGSFYRQFTLPETADVDQVTAIGKNGVLQISIAKKPIAQPRKIAVEA